MLFLFRAPSCCHCVLYFFLKNSEITQALQEGYENRTLNPDALIVNVFYVCFVIFPLYRVLFFFLNHLRASIRCNAPLSLNTSVYMTIKLAIGQFYSKKEKKKDGHGTSWNYILCLILMSLYSFICDSLHSVFISCDLDILKSISQLLYRRWY